MTIAAAAASRSFASSFCAGAVLIWVMMPSIVLVGMVFGVMASTVGLTLMEAAAFSGSVYAGGAQMASLQGWADPVPLLFVSLTTAALNSRYVLMGATMRSFLAHRPAPLVYTTLFFLVDATWILAMRDRDKAYDWAGYLLGGGFVMWLMWIAATTAGYAFGRLLGDPHAYGLDFMLAAFFGTAAVSFWRHSRRATPLIVALVVAILAQKLIPGPWYILIGALIGSLTGAIGHARAA
ncbi:MAG TPA: AzlC family ABC transporter permease [Alphaproteobacteria bacterium]|nr:AzlC family ABC transporter permease [Alphaproteobacteria bacterium]